MKLTIHLLALLMAATIFGQSKDKRSKLDIYGRADEISVSPDEKIWLVSAMGNMYYTNNITSDWHYGKSFGSGELIGAPFLERISFFNKDIAIMTGYIPGADGNTKSGYFLTSDGGENWTKLDFGNGTWIYDIFVDANGHAWMGGSSGSIHYSNDFGQHWKELNSPYDGTTRMAAIFMSDPLTGVSGALHGNIYFTSDNWKSSKKIATPYQQQKYKSADSYGDDRINKILLWNDYIVVNQNGQSFYTKTQKIDWKPFPIKIIDFDLDTESKTLFAVTQKLQIAEFSSPEQFQIVTEKTLTDYPLSIRVVNHSLYVLSSEHEVYRVNKEGLVRSIPYTSDRPIEEPRLVRQGTNLKWGIEENQLYITGTDGEWYREDVLDVIVHDFQLTDDSNAILWDGDTNFSYSINDNIVKIYNPLSPLKDFLAYPIKSFTIQSGTQGCFHSNGDEVTYENAGKALFTTTGVITTEGIGRKQEVFTNSVDIRGLESALLAINSDPSGLPSIKDFDITAKDKRSYLAMADEKVKNMDVSKKEKTTLKEFYNAVPNMLDTISVSTLDAVFNWKESVWSTTSNWTSINIVNQQNDTLIIWRSYYDRSLPWNLPWKFRYKKLNFNCYNIAFSKFINSCLPPGFMNKEIFDNRLLLMEIAGHYKGLND